MEMVKSKDSKTQEEQKHESVKGTMFSVGVVGAVIFITYVVLFGLYMARV
ncbi:cytochrome c oxidase subunit 2A [Bacillus sp. FJAT-29790]|nr:cytochrome c oxidase subunit 2A [Bacillus sp. FJAT-29790]MBU8877565.1 cytochrome c oxidase subunit 2A [Bacillus sp. FJAT-29790]